MSDTPALTLEERVAALEEALPHITPARTCTDDELAKWQAKFDKLMDSGRYEIKVLPPAPLLTPETARALLRECVTVVQPGEVLAVRIPDNWSAAQMDAIQDYADASLAGIRVAFLPGEEFAVQRQEPEKIPVGLKITEVACPRCGRTAPVECGDLAAFVVDGVLDIELVADEARRIAGAACPYHRVPTRVGGTTRPDGAWSPVISDAPQTCPGGC